MPKTNGESRDISTFENSIIAWLDETVNVNLTAIIKETVNKYEKDIRTVYSQDFTPKVIDEIIEGKINQFQKISKKIIHKEIDDLVFPVLKSSILHTNKSSKQKKNVNEDAIDSNLLTLKHECIKMDIEEYLNFFESIDVLELEKRTNNHDESIVIPQDPEVKDETSIEIDDEEVEIDGVHESIRRYNIIFG
ncbi:hypothetical protein FOG51_01568 [Hanseniaspora uvarum]|nr:hypothetical protein FOG48_01815 [Hanseniaspora uvarum]KAF0273532.1 hypothetical protein FOG51_01568 [Hanseniaspora uvarum]KAF0276622.1 hypothetical protein FOG50_02537 [Hanseniaspora uvarum]GMM40099.1 hypothetical protein DAHU10_010000 [Hanseniaspora uvarum]